MRYWVLRLLPAAALALVVLGFALGVGSAVQHGPVQRLVVQGVSLVPLRTVTESLGATLDYQAGHIVVDRDEQRVILTVGDMHARVNAETRLMPQAPQVVDGTTYVPVRFLVEALGGTVTWDAATDLVAIHAPAPPPAIPLAAATETLLARFDDATTHSRSGNSSTGQLPAFNFRNGHIYYAESGAGGQCMVIDGQKGPIYDQVAPWAYFYDENRHVAYSVQNDEKQFVVVDGKEGTHYDKVSNVRLSDDQKRMWYVAHIGGKCRVVVDGQEITSSFVHEGDDYIYISRDCKRVAYTIPQGKQECMVVDGVAGAAYDEIWPLNPVFSQDSHHFAYPATRGKQSFVVVDGREGKPYDYIGEDGIMGEGCLNFTPDSKHVIYTAGKNNKWLVVTDDQEGPAYDGIGFVGFSPQDTHTQYLAHNGDQWVIVIDGKAHPLYDSSADIRSLDSDYPLAYSPDDTHVGYRVKKGDKWMMVIDGQEGTLYDALPDEEPVFSADSKHVAYRAQKGGKWMMVVDGREGALYDATPDWRPAFNGDYSQLVYRARKGLKWVMVTDGQESPPYENVTPPQISNASVTYVAQKGVNTLVMVVNGKEGTTYHGVLQPDIQQFGTDGTHFICVEKKGNRYCLVQDGQEKLLPTDMISDSIRQFGRNGMDITYVTQDKNNFSRVVARWESRPDETTYDIYSECMDYSKDEQHMTFEAMTGKGWVVIVDGLQSPYYDRLLHEKDGGPAFVSPSTVGFFAQRGDALYRVEMTLAGG